jgi:hypothetical protein
MPFFCDYCLPLFLLPTYRDTNYVTEESLKIELMAGGLNWSQQQFVMEKMEPNTLGEVSL